MNIYENCPVIENSKFKLRLISKQDTAELFKVYSDANSVPFFNSDNCDGDDFYYKTLERMKQAVDFWVEAYEKGWFVRQSIVDKSTGEVVGTVEAFHRESKDSYNHFGLFRLDLRSDYEKYDCILSLLELIVPMTFKYYNCTHCMTKEFLDSKERINALEKYGFKTANKPIITDNDVEFYNYMVMNKNN